MKDLHEATTVELLNVPGCKAAVADFAGMQDLKAFQASPDKLAALLDQIDSLEEEPSGNYTLTQLRHASEMVRLTVLKDFSYFGDAQQFYLKG